MDFGSPPASTPQNQHRRKSKGVLKPKPKAKKSHDEASTPRRGSTEESKFTNRFFALPQEVRNNVYRQLLVRPCKFDLYHTPECDGLGIRCSRPGPILPSLGSGDALCASCNNNDWKRTQQLEIFKSPARSKWGNHGNPYLCDICYWDIIGNFEGKPCLKSIRCLCRRHNNLQFLLVSKGIYEEAAPIFWNENTFAFEHPCLLIGFLTNIRPLVRSWIRLISFLPLHEHVCHELIDDSWETNVGWHLRYETEAKEDWEGRSQIRKCWSLLRECEGLMELELDVLFLKEVHEAMWLRTVRVGRKVTFWRHPLRVDIPPRHLRPNRTSEAVIDPTPWIWWSHSRRMQVDTPTTRLMERSMTGRKPVEVKELAMHFEKTPLKERYGGEIYPNILDS